MNNRMMDEVQRLKTNKNIDQARKSVDNILESFEKLKNMSDHNRKKSE